MGKQASVVFDFDGVITDSLSVTHEIFSTADSSYTLNKLLERFEGNVSESNAPITHREFLKEYEPRASSIPLFTDIDRVVANLSRSYKLAINSSGLTSLIKNYIDGHRLTRFFSPILGGDIETSKVKKFEMILHAHGTSPDSCAMVTDTLGDLREAHEAGVRTVAVMWGWHDEETLLRGNPTIVCREIADLPQAINDVLAVENLS